ncbi:MAG TPA: hypothetical protein PK156_44480 [Polyangium sp.]|nr:hypothetical protein [Polyangium sp.]
MNRIDDERVLFYLKHQQRIQEWAALAKEASEQAHQFLCSCADDLMTLARDLGRGVQTFVSIEDDYPKLFLYRNAWWPDKATTKHPRVGIGLEWRRGNVSFTESGKSAYCGVWVHYQLDGAKALHESIGKAFKDAGLLKKHGFTSSTVWWPAYRYEIAPPEFWNDLGPYRTQLIESIRFCWTTFEPVVNKLVR